MKKPINTFSQDEITCPYCGYRFLDSWEYEDIDDSVEIECGECEREFDLYVKTSTTYTTRKKGDME